MTNHRSGAYPIDVAHAEELDRLARQDAAWAPATRALLDTIGVGPGWRCLDLGCGPRGLTRTLAERVGPTGRVTGLDYNPDFVRLARLDAPANVEIVEGDAWATGLPADGFDLVHMRFVASTSGDADGLAAEAMRHVRPGGIVAMQEADAITLRCYPPHPAWDRLAAAVHALMPESFGGYPTAHRLYRVLHDAGFVDLGYRPNLVGVRAGDPWIDYWPSVALSARRAITGKGLMTEAELDADVAACRAHLSDPGTVFCSPTLVQVWGRKPGPA